LSVEKKIKGGGAKMHCRDDKPVAATAVVVAVVLGVGVLVRLIGGTYAPNTGHGHPATSAPLWVLAGE
jgi:hypothetical protein